MRLAFILSNVSSSFFVTTGFGRFEIALSDRWMESAGGKERTAPGSALPCARTLRPLSTAQIPPSTFHAYLCTRTVRWETRGEGRRTTAGSRNASCVITRLSRWSWHSLLLLSGNGPSAPVSLVLRRRTATNTTHDDANRANHAKP